MGHILFFYISLLLGKKEYTHTQQHKHAQKLERLKERDDY